MPRAADFVKQTTVSAGTGNMTLAESTGFQTFGDAFGTGYTQDIFYYFISDVTAGDWEVGTGHMSDATTLVRDTVIRSSNSDSPVSFSINTKTVISDFPSVYQTMANRPKLQMVATRTGLNTYQPLTSFGAETRMQHCLPYGAKSLFPVYSLFHVASGNIAEVATDAGYGYYATGATVDSGGTGYAVGDTFNVTVATNQFSPLFQVDAVSGGVVTAVSVQDGGGFGALPSTGLATTVVTGSGDNALTVTLTMAPCAQAMRFGLEQSWGTQTAVSSTNVDGVMPLSKGFNGALSASNVIIPYSDFVQLDSVNIGKAAGSIIGTRVYSPGKNFYCGRVMSGSASLNEDSFSGINLASANPHGGTYPTRVTPSPGLQPVAILGIPQYPGPTFCIIGDSIGTGVISGGGSRDTPDSHGNSGFIEKGIDRSAPWANMCVPGETISNWLHPTRKLLAWNALRINKPTHIVDQAGINDAPGVTYTAFKIMKIKLWEKLYGLGINEIWCTTITPKTTSTDFWATTENQSLTAASSIVQQFNADLYAGTFAQYGVTKILDITSAVETSFGSGIWQVGTTADGLHPTTSAMTSMAALLVSDFATAKL